MRWLQLVCLRRNLQTRTFDFQRRKELILIELPMIIVSLFFLEIYQGFKIQALNMEMKNVPIWFSGQLFPNVIWCYAAHLKAPLNQLHHTARVLHSSSSRWPEKKLQSKTWRITKQRILIIWPLPCLLMLRKGTFFMNVFWFTHYEERY